jgi:hypothetical protein
VDALSAPLMPGVENITGKSTPKKGAFLDTKAPNLRTLTGCH